MKQVLQSLGSGATEVASVPAPGPSSGNLLVQTSRTLISAGTERMLVEFGKAGLLAKARQQPDKVRMVAQKVMSDGVGPTIESVRNKLDQPLPLGYCNVGHVVHVGSGVSGFAAGVRVASNGKHAELVSVPSNLCAIVPDSVPDEEAAFTVLAAIALQGIRLTQPSLGEAIVVTGLGLVGLLAVQLLRANGCRVLGLDFDAARLALAESFGAETVNLAQNPDPVSAALAFSRGRGVDAVVITASTQSSVPMHQAALMCRQRGRIVLIGVVGLELSRDDFYKKELTFQVSSSYGPGRYDAAYEEKGQDYPVGFVRWTAQRNFEAVLDMMADRRLDVRPLISHRFLIAEAREAYALVVSETPSLGILLDFSTPNAVAERTVALGRSPVSKGRISVSFIGAGKYATGVLIPAFQAAHAGLRSVASSAGVTGFHAARKFGFATTTTDTDSVFADETTDAVVVLTRHDSHARFVLQSLRAGKDVFVEKPLCLTDSELDDIVHEYGRLAEAGVVPRIMVGFNRRFAPHIVRIKSLLNGVRDPKAFVLTVNAGAIATGHWTQDMTVGGGRILGEACHFVDLLRFLAGCGISSYSRITTPEPCGDTTSIQLSFADGSIGTIHYFANGSKSFPKERLDVFAAGRVLQLDNFRRLKGYGWPGFTSMKLWNQDKGQRGCVAAFVSAVETGGACPIPFDEIVEVSRVSIALSRPL